jgi:hypothetical protein
MGISVTGLPGYLRLYHRRDVIHRGTSLGDRALQCLERRAIDMGKIRKLHRPALRRVEHPARNLDEHRIRCRLRQLAEICRIRVRSTRDSG